MSVFVDTSGWFAAVSSRDPNHERVIAWLRENPLPLITSDYVIDETLTLLRARGEGERAIRFGRRMFDLAEANIQQIDAATLRRAWELFRDQPQRRWSFTDCTSKALMDLLHIRRALCFDHHFGEFEDVELVA